MDQNRSTTYQKTSDTVRRYGFNFRKRFGQNFLTDESVLEKIVESSGVSKEDLVIEIGPGLGTLTRRLSEAAGQVAAIEIDRDLVKILRDTLKDCGNVRILEGDVLKTDLAALAAEYGIRTSPTPGSAPGLKVVANLPYYITTPILMQLFEKGVPADRITVMVQKEVAERMTAETGSSAYGSLSLAVQYYADARIETLVPASCFLPRPKVDSAVVSMDVWRKKPVTVKDERLLKAVIRAAFSQRRKTLCNSLGNAPQVPVSRAETASLLEQMGLSPSIRGERLSLTQFAELTDRISECSQRGAGIPSQTQS